MLKKALKKAKQDHILRPDVSGISISRKIVNGKQTNEDCITIFVPRKLPLHLLTKSRIIEKEIEGIRTDVVEAIFKPQAVYGYWVDPLRPGVSIGSESLINGGTLGCIVYNIDDGTEYVLTNYHVVYGPNDYEYICQPGRIDGGRAFYDRFGKTSDSFVDSTGDAAVIEIDQTLGRESFSMVYGSDQRLLSIEDGVIDDLVEKVGRRTGQTYGKVNGTGTYTVDYSPYGLGSLNIDGFTIIARDDADPGYQVSLPGDSGAVWYDSTENEIRGLHFAGTDDGSYAIACSIETVFETLNISLNQKKAKSSDGVHGLSLPWFSQSGSQETVIDIVPPGDFYNVYAFTTSDFFGAVYCRLYGETDWKLVGGESMHPSGYLGNFLNSKKMRVQFKIEGSVLGNGLFNVPIFFGHGEDVDAGGI